MTAKEFLKNRIFTITINGIQKEIDFTDELISILDNYHKAKLKLLSMPAVRKRFSIADFAIGLMIGVFGTIIALGYIL